MRARENRSTEHGNKAVWGGEGGGGGGHGRRKRKGLELRALKE